MDEYSFKDASGATYQFRVTFKTIFRVADKVGVDLLDCGQVEDGDSLSERLLHRPGLVVKVVAALCGVDDLDAFYDAIDAASYKEMERTFWDAYVDFFDQSGREYMAEALKADLKLKRQAEIQTKEEILKESQRQSYSVSSPLLELTTGKTEPSGKSTASPKLISNKTAKTAPSSSAPSTTPTRKPTKTSGARATSTSSKKSAPNEKRKSS